MEQKTITMDKSWKKRIIILLLYVGAPLILLLGVFFSTFSVLNNITFPVLNTSVHGIVFGLLVAYLGLKNYFMVSNFEDKFYQSNEPFSWSNFKKSKKHELKK